MTEPRYPRPRYRISPVIWALLVFVLVLLGAGGWFLRQFWQNMATPPPAEVQRPMRTVTLYFSAPDGSGLMGEGRQVPDCLVEEDCLRSTLQALIDGPVGALAPALPPRSVLNGVAVDGEGVLQIDFGQGLIDNHPGGSWAELLTVYALADTIAANFPQLRRLRILIDGTAVETLKGHVDLRQPITPDFSLVSRNPDANSPDSPAKRP